MCTICDEQIQAFDASEPAYHVRLELRNYDCDIVNVTTGASSTELITRTDYE